MPKYVFFILYRPDPCPTCTDIPQPFHNDVCDILSMYVQETAAEGGESRLASCATVYNEIAATRPDVIHTLAKENWIFDKFSPAGEPAFYRKRGLLYNFEGHGPSMLFSRRPITGSPNSPHGADVPPMSEVQAEALDMVHFSALKHCVSMNLQRGDIQLVNNLAIQHSRNAFKDTATQKRHIIRLWLRNEKLGWAIPKGLQQTLFAKYTGPKQKLRNWNIMPGAPLERVLYKGNSCS
jgi:hypothetical protein